MSKASINPARISRVIPDSIASELGFEAGDAIIAINGTQPQDLIDYQFLCADEYLTLEVLDAQGKTHNLEIEKDYDEDLGLEFETALFDGLKQCNNNCPFCFIDQQPPYKRASLYLKDDDYRLSFLYGSYLTLTNLTSSDWQRIAQMRLSPLYVSVHATNPELRTRLLKNPRAAEILNQLAWFQHQRLQIHAQIVVCPGINDDAHLDQTILDLSQFHRGDLPTVISAAVVPVGLTRFRPVQDSLTPVTPYLAQAVIQQVQALQSQFLRTHGSRFVWLADEWFLIAGLPLPPASEYEDYPQIGNGVGSIQQFIDEFHILATKLLPSKIPQPVTLSWVVGNAVELAFQPLVARLNQVEGLTVNLVALNSDYWGQEITVTGLLTGHDLLKGLKGENLGDGVLLPTLMLKEGDNRFLDDLTIAEVGEQLQIPIFPVNGIRELMSKCLEVLPQVESCDKR